MSIEESSKSILLSASYQQGVAASQLPKIKSILRDHKKKIALVVQLAKDASPFIAEALQGKEAELVDHINNLKNETMYVSLIAGKIATPEERVRQVQLEAHIQLAERMAQWADAMSSTC